VGLVKIGALKAVPFLVMFVYCVRGYTMCNLLTSYTYILNWIHVAVPATLYCVV